LSGGGAIIDLTVSGIAVGRRLMLHNDRTLVPILPQS
jgi:hypothetical protein